MSGNLPLFDQPSAFDRHTLASKLVALAQHGIYFGTSSWRYPGWLGSVYTSERYQYRGKFSKKRFEEISLSEYAETFPLVGCDFSFYGAQPPAYWDKLFPSAPSKLKYLLKAPEEFTVKKYSSSPRYGDKAGQPNPKYLDVGAFTAEFIDPIAAHQSQVAAIVLEFGTFSQASYFDPNLFFSDLDQFLAALPAGFRYAVEIRNEEYLRPEYFSVLKQHGVAHVFNAWTRMPPVMKQIANPLGFTAGFVVSRALLRVGRAYENAVKMFEPYDSVKEPNPRTREALQEIAMRSREERRRVYITVNNRLEGFAPGTIAAVVDQLDISE